VAWRGAHERNRKIDESGVCVSLELRRTRLTRLTYEGSINVEDMPLDISVRKHLWPNLPNCVREQIDQRPACASIKVHAHILKLAIDDDVARTVVMAASHFVGIASLSVVLPRVGSGVPVQVAFGVGSEGADGARKWLLPRVSSDMHVQAALVACSEGADGARKPLLPRVGPGVPVQPSGRSWWLL
jgi:hypothetical protein